VTTGNTGSPTKCSFCGKSPTQVKKLIAGPTAYICDECVDLCGEILAHEHLRAEPPEQPERNQLDPLDEVGADGSRTLEEVSRHFNLTRGRVREIEARAIAKLSRSTLAPSPQPERVGSRLVIEVVRAGRSAEEVAAAYEALANAARRLGLDDEAGEQGEVAVVSVETKHGPGAKLAFTHRLDSDPSA
jgi:hypothetical protein